VFAGRAAGPPVQRGFRCGSPKGRSAASTLASGLDGPQRAAGAHPIRCSLQHSQIRPPRDEVIQRCSTKAHERPEEIRRSIGKVHEHIDVAACTIEVLSGLRTDEVEERHAVPPARSLNAVEVAGDEIEHRVERYPHVGSDGSLRLRYSTAGTHLPRPTGWGLLPSLQLGFVPQRGAVATPSAPNLRGSVAGSRSDPSRRCQPALEHHAQRFRNRELASPRHCAAARRRECHSPSVILPLSGCADPRQPGHTPHCASSRPMSIPSTTSSPLRSKRARSLSQLASSVPRSAPSTTPSPSKSPMHTGAKSVYSQ